MQEFSTCDRCVAHVLNSTRCFQLYIMYVPLLAGAEKDAVASAAALQHIKKVSWNQAGAL